MNITGTAKSTGWKTEWATRTRKQRVPLRREPEFVTNPEYRVKNKVIEKSCQLEVGKIVFIRDEQGGKFQLLSDNGENPILLPQIKPSYMPTNCDSCSAKLENISLVKLALSNCFFVHCPDPDCGKNKIVWLR
ncbi:MAG: hypothetical protein CEN89_585 [Candidatus Berkelbacteria bacterium Licking1014_7]|uniref:Uncharacterized protein n=1 Tax=Candidatus Berkelbacteria bacterium Licking1014_7 TaxID=2017147 RepID=A0A554LIF4_9BACT|nr:MAG: hypothetical protein CEN89_585 [Candidatus Berkelbacteria bacterium Licking1014_7]